MTSLEMMRRHEPASSPTMKSVLHLDEPGHSCAYQRSSTACGMVRGRLKGRVRVRVRVRARVRGRGRGRARARARVRG